MKKFKITIDGKSTSIDGKLKVYIEAYNQGIPIAKIARDGGVTDSSVRGKIRRLREFFGFKSHTRFKEVDIEIEENEIKENSFTEKQIQQLTEPEVDNAIEFLKEQVKHQKKLLNRYKKGSILEDKIYQLFEEAVNLKRPTFSIKRKPPKVDKNEELILLIGDVHAGNIVDSNEVMGLNSYNMDVMKDRMKMLFDKVNTITDRISGYEDNILNIFFMGDIVSGLIHDELLQGVAVIDQVHITGYIMIEIIEEWSKRFHKICVSGVVGNHGRLKKQVTFKKVHDNFDKFFYKFVELGCRHLPNVEFNLPDSKFMIQEILGHNFLLAHGDSKVQSYAGIPFYGIKRFDTNLSQTMMANKGIYIDYTVLGHYHGSNSLDKSGMGKIIINGCMSGTDEFALNAMGVSGMAKQVLMSVNRNEGINFLHDILLDKNIPI